LFGGSTSETLRRLDDDTLLSVFDGVPRFDIALSENLGLKFVDILTEKASVFESKGEMRKLVQNGGFFINKEKVASADIVFDEANLLNGKYILVQKGKKNYFLLTAK
jgi:tyrosyl-tRNA synthetase